MAGTTSPVTLTNNVTVTPFSGGVNGAVGRGATTRVTFSALAGYQWQVNDEFVFQLITSSQTFDLGTGRMTGLVPTRAITLADRVHFVADTYWNGSDNGDATGWEQQAPGAFQIDVSNQNQQPEPLLSLASFQGRMALWSRQTVQLWNLDANPDNIALAQVLNNIGTISPYGPQSLGDFDVLFPSDSGIRSLRIQTINLNGFISDIGGPIDTLVKAAIRGQTANQLAGICSTVDPVGNRYMIYFPSINAIYVLSYFPASKITAWSAYTPSNYDILRQQTPFVIQKFLIYNGTVYIRASINNGNYFLTYGGSNGVYDNIQPIMVTPWFDLKKAATRKTATEIDYALQGQWSIYGSMDFNGVTNNNGPLQEIATQVNPSGAGVAGSFQTGSVDWTDEGFHVQLKAVGDDMSIPGKPAVLSELVFHYLGGDEK